MKIKKYMANISKKLQNVQKGKLIFKIFLGLKGGKMVKKSQ